MSVGLENDMTCKELVELVTDYLERRLSSNDLRRFEAHLASCEGCTAYVAQMRRTIELVGSVTEADIAPAALDELLRAFRSWKTEVEETGER
ncbi:MAG: zf-HC2 domain-containing protein [Solirubrobacteraceae bacterium]